MKNQFQHFNPTKKNFLFISIIHFFSPSLDYELYTGKKWNEDSMYNLCCLPGYCLLQFNVLHLAKANYENWKIYVFASTMYPSLYMLCWIIHSLSQTGYGWKWGKIHKNKLNTKKKVLHKNIFILLFLMSFFNVNIEFTSNSQLLFFS